MIRNSKKGFTLIELLAVIIILGIIMIIAIPGVTSYISDSRKATYIATAKRYIEGARNIVNGTGIDMYDTDTTYYIPISCIKIENGGGRSPYGDFKQAYVIVSYDGDGYDYYWASTDTAKMGISHTDEKKLKENLINTDVSEIDTSIAILPDSKIKIIDGNDCKSGATTDAISSYFPESNNSIDLYNIEYRPRTFDFSGDYTYYVNNEGTPVRAPLSVSYNNSFWSTTGDRTFYLFKIHNDVNYKRYASFEINLPVITRKDTGENVPINRWYFDLSIDYLTKEKWNCSGTASELSVSCISDKDIYATSSSYDDDAKFNYSRNLYLYLSDNNIIEIPMKWSSYSYYIFRFNNYIFPGSFIESSYNL